jgi:hypothetical protein
MMRAQHAQHQVCTGKICAQRLRDGQDHGGRREPRDARKLSVPETHGVKQVIESEANPATPESELPRALGYGAD